MYGVYNKELEGIRDSLKDISRREAMKLYRLAWRMVAHNCDPKEIEKVREEARFLDNCGCGQDARLLDPFYGYERFKYAFKF